MLGFTLLVVFETPELCETRHRAGRLAQDSGALAGGAAGSCTDPCLRQLRDPASEPWVCTQTPLFCPFGHSPHPTAFLPTNTLAFMEWGRTGGEAEMGSAGHPLFSHPLCQGAGRALLSMDALPLPCSRLVFLISCSPCCCPHLAAFCR